MPAVPNYFVHFLGLHVVVRFLVLLGNPLAFYIETFGGPLECENSFFLFLRFL
jgi:hypothetical protein